jgi:uncharacterized membrane protein YjgN (DUF898 family)
MELSELPADGLNDAPESNVLDQSLQNHSFNFYGSGSEYFRIWIVNILLTLLTLGVYSAWAKVRRMKYFYENTELMGARFGYHADPKKVLKGRFLAVVAVGGFYLLAHFFPAIEPFGSLIWVAALPVLLALALYFRLRNSSYRGLRFEFEGTLRQSYQALWLPLTLALFGLATIAIGMNLFVKTGKSGLLLSIVFAIVYLVFPIIVMPMFQVQWKRYAHQHSLFGTARFGFTATVKQYIKSYLGTFLVLIAALVPISLLIGVMMAVFFANGIAGAKDGLGIRDYFFIIAGIGVFYLAMLVCVGPYIKAVFFNLAWNNTKIGAHRFTADVPIWGMVGISASNFILILLTLGFYRPFAVIRTQKYLLSHLFFQTIGEPSEILRLRDAANPNAASEGALDLFGDMDM